MVTVFLEGFIARGTVSTGWEGDLDVATHPLYEVTSLEVYVEGSNKDIAEYISYDFYSRLCDVIIETFVAGGDAC